MSEIMLKSVYDLLDKNYFIPSYQRGYRWGKRQVQDLLEDLYKFATNKDKSEKAFYCLQPIVVKRCDEKTITDNSLHSNLDNNTWYEVIDGQQRLTTLYILFRYLINACGKDIEQYYGRPLFKIEYQTRGTDKDVVLSPENYNSSTPNAFYISEAYQNISKWFNELGESKKIKQVGKIKDMFFDFLTNSNDESDEPTVNSYGYVQVIWYESTDPDPIKIFTRLNIGKIPLRNAELIKALFLQKRDDTELSEIQQIQIAKEWDQIEATLQDKRIWAFLNENIPDMPAHIEFIFNVIFNVEGKEEKKKLGENQECLSLKPKDREAWIKKKFEDKYGTDDYATFRFFSERFEKADRDAIKKQWDTVREYYETFNEWYNNPLWYHYIGFLIYCKEPIINIYEQYQGKTKRDFVSSLISLIQDKLKVTLTSSGDIEKNGTPVVYDNKTKECLKQLLVLYNIEYIVQKNKDNDLSYVVFPFDLFKIEKWDIEHVDSFTTNPLTDKAQQKEWLETAIEDLDEIGINYKTVDKITDLERTAITNFIDGTGTQSTFDEIKLIVSKLADEALTAEESSKDAKNSIGNLTLLNADINRSYGNSIFPSKRKIISERDAAGRFIPICTKNVFLKNFANGGSGTIAWQINDMDNYKKNIVSVIKKFLIEEIVEEGAQ